MDSTATTTYLWKGGIKLWVIGRERGEALKFCEERDISEGERNYKFPIEE